MVRKCRVGGQILSFDELPPNLNYRLCPWRMECKMDFELPTNLIKMAAVGPVCWVWSDSLNPIPPKDMYSTVRVQCYQVTRSRPTTAVYTHWQITYLSDLGQHSKHCGKRRERQLCHFKSLHKIKTKSTGRLPSLSHNASVLIFKQIHGYSPSLSTGRLCLVSAIGYHLSTLDVATSQDIYSAAICMWTM